MLLWCDVACLLEDRQLAVGAVRTADGDPGCHWHAVSRGALRHGCLLDSKRLPPHVRHASPSGTDERIEGRRSRVEGTRDADRFDAPLARLNLVQVVVDDGLRAHQASKAARRSSSSGGCRHSPDSDGRAMASGIRTSRRSDRVKGSAGGVSALRALQSTVAKRLGARLRSSGESSRSCVPDV